jgi:predicted dehydrogenase
MVAACDREILLAEQLCDRFPIRKAFDDVDRMLSEAKPDVVHITTPPASHFDLGRRCLEAGAHVYMEKPFALNADETRRLLELAESLGRKMTVGHDLQFSHAMRRTRALIRQGYVGGSPVHMESYYCYDLGDPRYAKALLADRNHWVRQLPGKLLHNIISHGVARIAEHLNDDAPEVHAFGHVSKTLRDLGETDIIDELRAVVRGSDGATAYFTFSSQMQPSLNHFRVFGRKNGIIMDEDDQTVIRLRGPRYKSYAEKFIPPVSFAKQYLGCLRRNLGRFLACDFHMKSGMKCLIESFYRSITDNSPLPLSYREILLTARIMDDIFRQTVRSQPPEVGR